MANKVILDGRVGKDVDLRFTAGGVAVVNFSLATSKKYTNKNGEKKEETEWHQILAWKKLAENCSKVLYKGREIYVEGEIHYRTYDDKSGNKRSVTEIVAAQVEAHGPKRETSEQHRGYISPEPEQQEPFTDAPKYPDDEIPF